jgi:hypothetical protein
MDKKAKAAKSTEAHGIKNSESLKTIEKAV